MAYQLTSKALVVLFIFIFSTFLDLCVCRVPLQNNRPGAERTCQSSKILWLLLRRLCRRRRRTKEMNKNRIRNVVVVVVVEKVSRIDNDPEPLSATRFVGQTRTKKKDGRLFSSSSSATVSIHRPFRVRPTADDRPLLSTEERALCRRYSRDHPDAIETNL